MSANKILVELGYTTSPSGISEFQRDFNRIATRPLLVTGTLDAETTDALEFAYRSRVVFAEIRKLNEEDRNA